MTSVFKSTIMFVALAIGFSACSTSGQEKGQTIVNYQLVKKPNKVFPLDDETGFDQISGQYVEVDGVGYYTFMNKNNRKLYFYEYETGDIALTIPLSKDGPNEVLYPYGFFEFFVHDFNNIFLNSLQFQYHINRKGEVLKRIKEERNFSFGARSIGLGGGTSYENELLYTNVNAIVPDEGDTNWQRTIYNFEAETHVKEYIDASTMIENYDIMLDRLREMAKAGGVSSMSINFAGDHRNLYGASEISDSLYYYNESQLIRKYYAGDPNIQVTDLQGYLDKTLFESTPNSVSISQKMEQPPFYTKMMNSPDSKLIYRILIHGTKAGIAPDSGREYPKIIGASLIIFNTETKTSGSVELPIDDIELSLYQNDIFVTPEGIHFPIKETETEDEKSYYVLDVETQS